MANGWSQWLLILVLQPVYAAAQDDMSEIAAGVYQPLYVSKDNPAIPVAGFKLDKTPVTNQAFYTFVQHYPQWKKTQKVSLLAEENYLRHWPTVEREAQPRAEDAQKPVVNVSWFAAQAYCQAQQKRLPTVAEWEYVALASVTQVNASQDEGYRKKILDWYAKAANQPLTEVGQDSPNVWGVHNMHGLIWEWTEDFNAALVSGESRNDSSVDTALYCASGSVGAVNPNDYAAFMREGFRSSLQAKFTLNSLGFRCAQDLTK